MTAFLEHHARSLLFALMLLAIGGFASAFFLPVTLFPQASFPRIQVALDAGDRSAEQMALEVTLPIEQAIRRVPGVTGLRSTTSRGSGEVSVNFRWGEDMALKAVEVNAAIGQILPQLPPGTILEVRRMDPTVFPMLAYSLTSERVPLTTLRELAQFQLTPLLSGVEGVARVDVQGGEVSEYQVEADPALLQSRGLSLADLAAALTQANDLRVVGRLEDHYKLFLMTSGTPLTGLVDIENIAVQNPGGAVVRLKDVAAVRAGVKPQWIRVTADGRDAVLFTLNQQPDGNSVQIADEVRRRLAAYPLPPGVVLANWYDQSRLTLASSLSVRDAMLIGSGLAALVLLVFLRSWRVTLIALFTVPAVLAATVLLLSVLNMSFNIMTLGGMAAAVGLVIDDVIVMIEHLVRRSPQGVGILTAAREFAGPLAGSSAATLVIFVPLAFLTSVTGAFFKALALTMAAALFISFWVSLIGVPLLARLLFKPAGRTEPPARQGRLACAYTQGLNRLFNRPWLMFLFIAPLIAAGGLAYWQVGSGFMPVTDEGGFVLDYLAASGTSLAETDRLLRQVEAILRANPSVATYSRRTGLQLGWGLTESNQGDIFVRLKDGPRPSIEKVMDDIRRKIETTVPGLEIELFLLIEDVIGDLTAVPQPVEVKLYTDNPVLLEHAAKAVAARLARVPGLVDVKDGINLAGDAIVITPDPAKTALEGMSPGQVLQALNDYLVGAEATRFPAQSQMIGVRVRLPESLRRYDSSLSELQLRTPNGYLFPLGRVAEFHKISGEPQIRREDLQRMVGVTARLSGRDLGSAMHEVRAAVATPGLLPAGVRAEYGGLYAQQQQAFGDLARVFAAALALVFVLLLFLYERFRVALVVLALPLLATGAVFIGLWLTSTELNISAMMGLTMIIGIVTETAIFYFSEWRITQGDLRERLIQAGQNRARPIIMTTLAAILTLLPLALGSGQGAGMLKPLATAIIAGLIVQLPLVLLVAPALFYWMSCREAKQPSEPFDRRPGG